MTKIVLLKLLLAAGITLILMLPEYFKTSKGNTLELSCLKTFLQSNFTSLFPLNFSFVTFVQPIRETQLVMGIFQNHTNFQNFARICRNVKSEFKRCHLCLACESKGNRDFISQKQTSKGLVMRGSIEENTNYLNSSCRHLYITVPSAVNHLEEYNITQNLKAHTYAAMSDGDPTQDMSRNHTCTVMNYLNNCTHISLHLEMDVKNFICSIKITWYILVLLVFIFSLIFTIYKILEDLRRAQKWQSHKYTSTSALLRESDSEKLQTLNVWVVAAIIGKKRAESVLNWQRETPMSRQMRAGSEV
ncbi:transmembrane protein 156 [Sorex araneus]|uniref:transmembrane protein 156 n=1 Tax=Sorex araneus TaxID=42254 RepID=UPI002433907A|nr:transmembrane protein 156 [Sorex araneus]